MIIREPSRRFELSVPLVIVGGGACGLVAALAAKDRGASVLVLERDRALGGSTALSSGFIPAAGTRFQHALGIADSPRLLERDIQAKAHGEAEPAIARAVAEASGPTIEWLADRHGIEFIVLDNFLYPGFSVPRMHAVPEKTGSGLMAALAGACGRAGIDILTEAHTSALFADNDNRILGVRLDRPDGSSEEVGCGALILACSGFGGNAKMVREYIPEIADALFFGHVGNQGDALRWGRELGAAVRDMSAYQGHGSVASPHGVLITWALMMEGGIQVNAHGERFSNEHQGYSEQAVSVLAQPGRMAWNIYDERLHELGTSFPDYRDAHAASAVKSAPTIAELASVLGLPGAKLEETIASVRRMQRGEAKDSFGRDFTLKPSLAVPFYAVKVTGALFHTQGGLLVDDRARVLREDGSTLPNVFAGGGAACGVSGAHVWGYLSGNGLLTAVNLGRLAGEAAAMLIET